jgi:hypothetical protein
MKVQKTFTIDKEIYEKFLKYTKNKSINKSLFVENSMKKLLKKDVTN